MERITLVGSGGCMRELFWQIMEANKIQQRWVVDGYVDLVEDLNFDGIYPCKYLGDDDYLLKKIIPTNVAICVGDPNKRMEIARKYESNPNFLPQNLSVPYRISLLKNLLHQLCMFCLRKPKFVTLAITTPLIHR